MLKIIESEVLLCLQVEQPQVEQVVTALKSTTLPESAPKKPDAVRQAMVRKPRNCTCLRTTSYRRSQGDASTRIGSK